MDESKSSEPKPADETVEEIRSKMEELEKKLLGTPKTPFAPISTTARKIKELEASFTGEKPSVTTKLPILQPISFSGVDLDEFVEEFSRWLRLSGVLHESEEVKIDWLVEFSSPKVRPVVKKITKEKHTISDVLEEMAKLFPKMENDLTIRAKVEKVFSFHMHLSPVLLHKCFLT